MDVSTADLELDGVVVQMATRRVLRAGRATRLTPKAMGVLGALVDAGGDVLLRAELLDRVWPDVHVGEEVLTQAIAELRRAFGDDARRPRIIETISKRGYRLVVDAEARRDRSSPAATVPASIVTTGVAPADGAQADGAQAVNGVQLSAVGGPSVVVVPFDSLAGGLEARTVSVGLSSDIAGSLSRSRWLFVAAPGSAATLSATIEDPVTVARRLGVRYAVWGSVIVSSGTIRVLAHLCDASTDRVVWADRYERADADIFAVLDDIGGTVARTVETEIELHQRRVARITPIATLDAWGLFHRAAKTEYASSPGDIAEARALLVRAHAMDPVSSRIVAALATLDLREHMFTEGRGKTDALRRGLDRALAAVDLDTSEPDSRAALARALYLSGDNCGSLTHLSAAVEADPCSFNARVGFAWSNLVEGRHAVAIEQADIADRVSPFAPNGFTLHAIRAHGYALSGDLERARVHGELADLHPKSNDQTTALAAWCSAAAGQIDHARVHAARLRRARPDFATEDYFAWFRFAGAERDVIARHLRAAGL